MTWHTFFKCSSMCSTLLKLVKRELEWSFAAFHSRVDHIHSQVDPRVQMCFVSTPLTSMASHWIKILTPLLSAMARTHHTGWSMHTWRSTNMASNLYLSQHFQIAFTICSPKVKAWGESRTKMQSKTSRHKDEGPLLSCTTQFQCKCLGKREKNEQMLIISSHVLLVFHSYCHHEVKQEHEWLVLSVDLFFYISVQRDQCISLLLPCQVWFYWKFKPWIWQPLPRYCKHRATYTGNNGAA